MPSSAASRRMLSAPSPSRSTRSSAARVIASRDRFSLVTAVAMPYSVRYSVREELEMTISRVRRQATLAALAALVVTAAPASAGERVDFAMGLAQRTPGTSGALTLHVRFKAPGDPEGKPAPIRAAVFDAPEGTRFDPSRAAACAASDDELQARGAGPARPTAAWEPGRSRR